MEIFNQESEHEEGWKHVLLPELQKFNSPKRKTNSENGSFHKDEVHSMMYRSEGNCLHFSLPVWRFFPSTRNILEITHIIALKFKEGRRQMGWVVLYLAIHGGQLSIG